MLLFISLRDMPDLYTKGADWVWNLQLPPVLLLGPGIQGSQLNRLRIRAPFQERLPQSQYKFKQSQLWSRLFRGSKKYTEASTGLTLWPDLTWRDVKYVLGQMLLTPDSRPWVPGEVTTSGDEGLAWMWDKRKEGTQNSPPSYCESSSFHNRATLSEVFLKDSSECTLRL